MLTDAKIREIVLAHGFTIKEGLVDLKHYVFEAARAIEREATAAEAAKWSKLVEDNQRLVEITQARLEREKSAAREAAIKEALSAALHATTAGETVAAIRAMCEEKK